MKVRRRVELPNLRSYLNFEFRYGNLLQNIYYNAQFFNHFSGFFFFTLACVLLGFKWQIFWGMAAANVSFLLFVFLRTKRLAEGITVFRQVRETTREKSLLEVHYIITNETAFELNDLYFHEEFDGVQQGRVLISCARSIPPHTRFTHRQDMMLDAGMGIKTFKPISLKIKDDLGIFEFSIKFQQRSEVEVHPLLEETPEFKTSISPEAIDFGHYEINKRGDSNLFIGIREYRPGDPVRLINWKLTNKTRKVVINEFEKNTSSFVTLLIELCLDTQMGLGELSTWEMGKDLALSIATNELAKHNHVQVISHNLYIPFGVGKAQINSIEKHFTFHELTSASDSTHLRLLGELPTGGQIYYISPMLTSPRFFETLTILKQLRSSGQAVTIFVLDPYAGMLSKIKGPMRAGIMEMDRFVKNEFLQIEKELARHGIHLVQIVVREGGESLKRQIEQKARELIED
jgi:uncharacterized protein (DUF58 family)